jgi:hypothetical protein
LASILEPEDFGCQGSTTTIEEFMRKLTKIAACIIGFGLFGQGIAAPSYETNEYLNCLGCDASTMAAITPIEAGMGTHIVYDRYTGLVKKYQVACVATQEEPCHPTLSHAIEQPVQSVEYGIAYDMMQFEQNFPGFLQNKSLVLNSWEAPSDVDGSEWNVASIALDRATSTQPAGANYYRFTTTISAWLNSANAPPQVREMRNIINRLTGAGANNSSFGLNLSWEPGPQEINLKFVMTTGTIDITYNPRTEEFQVKELRDPNGHPFPMRDSDGFRIDFDNKQEADLYGAVLGGAGVDVERRGNSGLTLRTAYLVCSRIGNQFIGCYIQYVY